jgi:hypothetical protein
MRPLALVSFGCLGPHLADVLEHHVHVAVECSHSAKQLSIVATVDKALAVGLDGFGKQSERTLVEDFFVRD